MSHKLPNGWTSKSLGEIFEFKNGFNADKTMYGKGKKFINVMEVIKNHYLHEKDIPGQVDIPDDAFCLYSVVKGDVLFNRTSETPEEIGLTAVYLDEEPVTFGGFVIRARPTGKILDQEFCKYCFLSSRVRKEIIKRGQGVIRANIGQGDLSDVLLQIPSQKEQEKIAKILSTWDKAIKNIESLIANKVIVKAHFLNIIFKGNLCLNGKTRECYTLDSLFTQRSDRGGEGDLLSVTRDRGIIPQNESDKKDTSNSDKSKYLRIYPNDIVYNTMRMWQGVSAVSRLQGLVSPAYTVCYLKNKEFNVDYFGYFFKNKKMVHEFHRRSQGLVDDTLNLKYENFRKIKIYIHPPEQQTAIARFFSTLDMEISMLQKQLIYLKTQKQGLLQQLLNGNKIVKV